MPISVLVKQMTMVAVAGCCWACSCKRRTQDGACHSDQTGSQLLWLSRVRKHQRNYPHTFNLEYRTVNLFHADASCNMGTRENVNNLESKKEIERPKFPHPIHADAGYLKQPRHSMKPKPDKRTGAPPHYINSGESLSGGR